MVDTFPFARGLFYGVDAVEKYFAPESTSSVCASRRHSGATFRCFVPRFWHQSTMWLQMDAALPPGWSRRFAQPLAAAAHAPGQTQASGDSTIAPALPAVGRQKDSRPVAARFSPGALAHDAHHWALAAQALSPAQAPSAHAPWPPPGVAALDATHRPQRRLDRRLQRVLPDARWHPVRSADGPRPLFVLSAD